MLFGDYVKEKRLAVNLSLRKFCTRVNLDPSNWSKVERNLLPPPYDLNIMVAIRQELDLPIGSPECDILYDLATIALGKLPCYIYHDEEVLNALPIFIRMASPDTKPGREELDKLIELIRSR